MSRMRADPSAGMRYDPSFVPNVPDSNSVDVEQLQREMIGVTTLADEGRMHAARRKVLFFVSTLALLGVFIAAAAGFSVRNPSKGDVSAAVLVVPTPDINVVCSSRSLESISSYVRCKKMCQPGLCCLADLSDVFSCLDANEDACRGYKVCENLDYVKAGGTNGGAGDGSTEGSDGATVADTIESVCSEDAVIPPGMTSPCEKICSPAACCFLDGEVECDVDCSVYAPCAFLYEGPAVITTKTVIEALCADAAIETPDGLAACEEACDPASCCFSSPSCFKAGVDVSCLNFVACATLYEVDEDDEFDVMVEEVLGNVESVSDLSLAPLTEDIDRACYREALKAPGGDVDCQELCEVSSCCWASGKESCFNTGQDVACHDYISCVALYDESYGEEDVEETPGSQENAVGSSEIVQGWAPSVCAPNLATAVYRCQDPELPVCNNPVSPTNEPCHMRCDTIYGFGEDACTEAGESCIQFVEGCLCPVPPCNGVAHIQS